MGFFKKAAVSLIALAGLAYAGLYIENEYRMHRENSERERVREERIQEVRRVEPEQNSDLDNLLNIISRDGTSSVDADLLEESVRAVARIGTQEAKMALYYIMVKESGDHMFGIVDGTVTEELYRLDPEMAVDAIISGRGWADKQMEILIADGSERSLLYLIERNNYEDLMRFVERNRQSGYIEIHKRPIIGVFEGHMRAGHPESKGYFCSGWERNIEVYGRMIASLDRNYASTSVVPKIRACEQWIGTERTEQLVQKLF